METCELLKRVTVPALDMILGMKYPVLDKGFVRVIDYMGDDSSVVQAARVSYGKGTKTVSEDEGLIRYLLRHTHTTPFEMCELKIHVRVPMDCWRQFIRHRTANVNEYSTRYSEAIDDKQQTKPEQWRTQAAGNKQGSAGGLTEWPKFKGLGSMGGASQRELELENQHELKVASLRAHYGTPGAYLTAREELFQEEARALYEERLDFDIAKEQARKDLPLSTYTEAYWKCDLHNILHFLSLRMDTHAQLEIRSFANVMGEIVEKWCPIAWKAWNDYNFRRGALLLSARDKMIIRSVVNEDSDAQVLSLMLEWGWAKENGKMGTNRERSECESKLASLSISVPWLQEGWLC